MTPNEQLTIACLQLGLKEPELVSVDRFRWTITEVDDQFYKNMLKLERQLQFVTSRPIDLRLETKVDKANRMKHRERMKDHVKTKDR